MKKVGVTLAAEQKAQFLSAMKDAAQSVDKFVSNAQSASGKLNGFNSAVKASAQAMNAFAKAQQAAAQATDNMSAKQGQSASAYTRGIAAVQQAEAAIQNYRQAQQEAAAALERHNALGTDATGNALREANANEQAAKAAAQSQLAHANEAVSLYETSKASQETAASSSRLSTAFESAGSAAKTVASHMTELAGKVTSVGFHALIDGAMSAARAMGDLGKAAMGAAVSGIKAIGSAAMDAVGGLVQLGIHLAEVGVRAAAAFTSSSIKTTQEFSQKMSEVAAVADATKEELSQMTDTALELGAKFPVSASDAADAMGELAKAGFTAKQSIEGASGVVQLASATHMSMADSATILANAINGFGLEAKDATKVTDLLAQTANASAVDVSDLGVTFKYVAPAAKAVGWSIEDVSKAIGVMGNAGIKGSTAGTTLRSVITRLASPTKDSASAMETLGLKITDASGKIRPFGDIMGELRAKFSQLSQVDQIDLAKKLAGQNAFSGFLAMITASPDAWNSMSDAIDHASGAGARMAATMNDNLAGAMENLKGSIETLKIKFGRALEPALKDAANAASGLVNILTDKMDKAITTVSRSVDAFKIALNGGFVAGPKITGMAATFSRLGEAIKPLVDAVRNFTAVLRVGQPTYDEFGNKIEGASKAVSGAHPIIDAIAKLVRDVLAPAFDKAAYGILAFSDKVGPLAEKFSPVISKLWQVYEAISPLQTAFDVLTGLMTGGMPSALAALAQHVEKLGDVFGVDLRPAIGQVEDFFNNSLVPAFQNAATFVQNELIPRFQQFGNWVVSDLIPALGQIGSFIFNDVLPKLQQFGAWIASNLVPIIQSMATTIMNDIVPALVKFGGFVSDTVIPKLSELWDTVSSKLAPVFEKAADIIANNVVPTIGKLVGVIMNDVIPVLTSWWSVIATVLSPAFDALVAVISNVLLPAAQKIWEFIDSQFIPIFHTAADVIQNVVMPILQALADVFNGAVSGAINAVVSLWNDLINQIKTGANIVGDIARGDWTAAWNDLQNNVSNSTTQMTSDVGDFAAKVAGAAGSTSQDFQTVGGGADFASGKIQEYNNTPVAVKNAVTNFSSVLAGVNSVIDALVRYNNTPVSAKNAAAPSAYASGTTYHKGGPALIGEGGQPELLTTRRGTTLITSPTFFSNLEQGAAVKPLSWSDLAGASTKNQAVDRTSGMGLPNFSSADNLGKALAMDAGRSVGSGLVAGIEAGLTGSNNAIQNQIGNLAKDVADKLGNGLMGGLSDVISRSKQSLQSVVDNVAGQLGGGSGGGNRNGGGGSGPSNPEINNAIKDLVSGIGVKGSAVQAIPTTSQINSAFSQMGNSMVNSGNNTKQYTFNLTTAQGMPTQGELQSTIGIAKALTF